MQCTCLGTQPCFGYILKKIVKLSRNALSKYVKLLEKPTLLTETVVLGSCVEEAENEKKNTKSSI